MTHQNAHPNARYMDSETYRKKLVRDGDRRFKEWHNSFLHYQKQFLQETRTSRDSASRLKPSSISTAS